MKNIILILSVLFGSFHKSVHHKSYTSSDLNHFQYINIDLIFTDWNKSTITSLKREILSNKDAYLKGMYENRLLAFKSYIDIKDYTTINKKSVRYKFLSLIKEDIINKDLMIVEANESGEQVIIQNYVVVLKDSTHVDIDKYQYSTEGWRKTNSFKNINLIISQNFNKYRTKYATGFNHDDIIITYLKNNHMEVSAYFFIATASNKSLEEILSK